MQKGIRHDVNLSHRGTLLSRQVNRRGTATAHAGAWFSAPPVAGLG
jgi:hypothetical protein